MSNRSRVIVAIASLLFGLVFFFPLWSISLEAPQYPEGLGLYIGVSDITGHRPHDLQNINGLNHYIGMKAIEPDSIPELKFMPMVVVVLMVSGLAVAAAGKRGLLYAWVGLCLVAALAGMVDFWLWQYDYGHNLDPRAAIKVPGMSYQPPLIGSKKLLNFTATAWPALGGIGAMLAVAVSSLVAISEWRQHRAPSPDSLPDSAELAGRNAA